MNPLAFVFRTFIITVVIAFATPVLAQDQSGFSLPKSFRDWFQTPEQQAKSAWDNGDNERLSEVAPNEAWQGAAAYRNGEFESAKEAFSGVVNPATTQPGDLARSVFNQATTDIQLGNYAQAIEQFDSLLAEQPEHADAIRNKAIAERLMELEQQSQQSEDGQGEQGEQGEEGEQGEDSNESEQSDSSESGEQDSQESEDSESSDGESSQEQGESSGEPSDESESDNSNDASGDEQSDEEIEAAREALQAAAEQAQDEQSETESQQVAAELSDEPLSEQDQASEQWLRQIPDNPDDLLRRKLLQNHRSEYPDVQVNGRGW